jgi:hypothetical protein
MSLYQLQKLMFHTHTRPTSRGEYRADPSAFAAKYALTEAERAAVLTVDIAALYRLGVHPLLLRPFTELNGVSSPQHYASLRRSQ